MNPGIKVKEPKNEARIIPINLLLFPRYVKMTLSGTRNSIIETRMSLLKKSGRILIILLSAILIALDVFFETLIMINIFYVAIFFCFSDKIIYSRYTLLT